MAARVSYRASERAINQNSCARARVAAIAQRFVRRYVACGGAGAHAGGGGASVVVLLADLFSLIVDVSRPGAARAVHGCGAVAALAAKKLESTRAQRKLKPTDLALGDVTGRPAGRGCEVCAAGPGAPLFRIKMRLHSPATLVCVCVCVCELRRASRRNSTANVMQRARRALPCY